MKYFDYGNREIDYLSSKDRALGDAILKIGRIEREVTPDLFTALVSSIVAQQISSKAFETIWNRIQSGLEAMNPEIISATDASVIQAFGMTMKKAFYIKALADGIMSGIVDLDCLQGLPDSEICDRLRRLNGIGVWTAEMLMIFSMQRPDIMSFSDLGIHRGLRMLHRHRTIDRTLFEKYRRRYSPYGSVASLYLWAIAGGACEGLSDPARKK